MKKDNVKILASNRKARHEYFIEDTIEVSILGFSISIIKQPP